MKAHIPPQTGEHDIYFGGFKWNAVDASFAHEIIKREETPEAITYFSEHSDTLSDYAYWFFLSTLWVSYTGHSDINLWKHLFSSDRPNCPRCLMKPSEYKEYRRLPPFVIAYRVHRPGESDWIAYTRSIDVALRFCINRNVDDVSVYEIPRRDILALFLRRGEDEIIVLDKGKAVFKKNIHVAGLGGATDAAKA